MKDMGAIQKHKIKIKIGLLFLFIFILQSTLMQVYIEFRIFREPNEFVDEMAERVASDLKYENGKWDTSLYNSDPLTAYPNTSASFPVYIITSDGFVIERSKPIAGLLDTSDYKHLLEFDEPQNINTMTNENWRVMSKVIKEDNVLGVIFVSYYNPESSLIEQIDQKLKENIENIDSQIKVTDGELDVSNLDVRNFHYDVSFEVVTKYNKVIANNGRTPSFIDLSYIQKELDSELKSEIEDSRTGEEFLIERKVIKDSENNEVGVIIVGKSISTYNQILRSLSVFGLLMGCLLSLPMTFLILYFLKRDLRSLAGKPTSPQKIKCIYFDKKQSFLLINNQRIEIGHDTNQYYLLKTLFSNSKRKWANDELLEIIGEEISMSNSRKIYDAALAINKKIGFKLVEYSGKSYSINNELIHLITTKPSESMLNH